MANKWGHSNVIGHLYVADEKRFGNSQAGLGIKSGDIVLCYEHAGDHFYDYILVAKKEGRLWGRPNIRIGSYSFETKHAELPAKAYHLLAAGYSVPEGNAKTPRKPDVIAW